MPDLLAKNDSPMRLHEKEWILTEIGLQQINRRQTHYKEMGKDIIHQKFGFLTPLYPTDRRVGGGCSGVQKTKTGILCRRMTDQILIFK